MEKVYGLWFGKTWLCKDDGTIVYDVHPQVMAARKQLEEDYPGGKKESGLQVREIGMNGLPVEDGTESVVSVDIASGADIDTISDMVARHANRLRESEQRAGGNS